jgi:hypothetical protein
VSSHFLRCAFTLADILFCFAAHARFRGRCCVCRCGAEYSRCGKFDVQKARLLSSLLLEGCSSSCCRSPARSEFGYSLNLLTPAHHFCSRLLPRQQ